MKRTIFTSVITVIFVYSALALNITKEIDEQFTLSYYCDEIATSHYHFILNQGGSQNYANAVFMNVYTGCCMSSSNPGADCSTAVIIN